MKAAVVQALGQAPVVADFDDPVAAAGENRIAVTASALSPLTRSRASGAHYSSAGRFPFVAGVDGVGRLDDGRRVYFILPSAPYGGLAERTLAPSSHCLPLPDDLDDVTAAAIANPGMSSWAALVERAKLTKGETVLVNGATGASGRLACQIARHLGAKRVIATGRNQDALKELAALGVDSTIPLVDDGAEFDRLVEPHFAAGVDVVIDYLWGRSAERLLTGAARFGAKGVPIRFVQVGNAGGSELALPGAVLRSSAITLMGSGIGSVSLDRLLQAIGGVLEAAPRAGLEVATSTFPLSRFAEAWRDESSAHRNVVTIGA